MTEVRSMPALGFDPTPGSVASTRDLGRALGTMSNELGTILSNIDGADRGSWQGEAATSFMNHLNDDLKPAVQKCHDSFSQASTLLYRWADQLDSFQAEAARLEHEAETKKGAVDSAKTTAYGPGGTPHPTPAPSGSDQAAEDAKNKKALDDAQSAMGDVLRRAHDLHDRFIDAAKSIADQLHHAGQLAPGKPGLFDRIADGIGNAFKGAWNWVKDHADMIKVIGDILSDISGVLGVLAIICAPFEPLGAIFGVAAVAFSGAALLTHLVAMAAGANVSWLTIGTDALGLLPGVGMLKGSTKMAGAAEKVAGRAADLGEGWSKVEKTGHSFITMAKKGDEAWKTFGVFGKKISVFGEKSVNLLVHDGSFANRAQNLVEGAYRTGQWAGTRSLNLLPHVNINTIGLPARMFDAGVKLGLKTFSIPTMKEDYHTIADAFHKHTTVLA